MAGLREEKARKTRAKLVAVARRLFAKNGFAATSTEEILDKAGVTRGALYHHFADKAALFEAVCIALHEEAVAAIGKAADDSAGSFEALLEGSRAWLAHFARPEVNRILIVEAPAVLGWEKWNALDAAHGFGELMQGVEAARKAGAIRDIAAEELAVLLNGAMNAAVLWSGHKGGKAPARMEKALTELLTALKRDRTKTWSRSSFP